MNTKVKIFTSVILSIAAILFLSGVTAPLTAKAAALTQAQIDSIISLLRSFGADETTISNVSTSLSGGTPTGGTTGGTYTFATDLKLGSTGTDVKNLQIVLNKDSATQVAVSGAGSSGNETTSFGSLTKAAVIKFQNKYASEVLTPVGLTAGTGYVGSLTRAKLNALYGTTGGTTGGGVIITPQGTGLTVTAGVQPTASLAPINTTRIPFTVLNFTASSDGDVTVNSIVVERTGLASDLAFSGVILLDETGLQIGLEKTLNSVHQVTLAEAFVVKAGTTKTLTIAGNRGAACTAGCAGQIGYLTLTAVNTSAAVHGTLPISGTGQTINESLTIGSITNTRGPLDPGATATKNVGTTGYTFSSIKITAGSAEKVRLLSIRWNQSGSAAAGDLANVKTYVDGTAYDTIVSSDGKYYTSTFGAGIVIDKGFSSEFYVKGDIVSGSARTVEFDVYKTTDLYLKGETYGYGIAPATSGTGISTGNPWYTGLAVTVAAGSLSVYKSTVISAQNIAINLENQVLGGFDVESKGEAVSVGSLVATLTLTNNDGAAATPHGTDIDNVSLYDENGVIVAGPVDATGAALVGTVTFTDTITFPVGKHTYTLKGKLTTDATNGFESNDTIIMSTTPSTSATAASNWTVVKGQNTGVTVYATPYTAITSNTITVKAGALDITVSSFPLAQTVIAGVSQFTFANYVLNAGNSGEDLAFNSIKLNYYASSTANAKFLTNCKLYDGINAITTGNNAVTPTLAASGTSFAFDSQFTLPKGTSKTFALKCDVAGDTYTGTAWQWGYGFAAAGDTTVDGYISPTGKVSGQTITETFPLTATAGAGQIMTTAAKGSYTVIDDSTPGYSIVAAGTTGVTLLKLKFVAVSEDIDIYKVDFWLPAGAATSTRADLVNQTVSLYDAANPTVALATAQFNQTDIRFASSTTIAPGAFKVPAGSSRTMLVKGDIATINATQGPLVGSGDLLQIGYLANNGETSGNYGKGVSSGTTINDGTATAFNSGGVRIMKAYPTFAKDAVPTTVLSAGSGFKAYRFHVTANNGDVYIAKLTYEISSSTGASSAVARTSQYGVYSYTDSAYSLIDSTFNSVTPGLLNDGYVINGLGVYGSASTTGAGVTTWFGTFAGAAAVSGGVNLTANGANGVVEVRPYTTALGTTTYKIPSGLTRYFELRMYVTGVESGTGSESLYVQLDGDSAYPMWGPEAYPTMGQGVGTSTPLTVVEADVNDDFIWSPGSTSTNLILTDQDFTNGYAVPGLPTTNMDAVTFTSIN